MFLNSGLGDCWPSVSANVKGDADQRVKSGVNVDLEQNHAVYTLETWMTEHCWVGV